MATNRILQLLRSNQVYESKSAAITAVTPMTGADGEIRLARYNAAETGEPENIKSLLCVYHAHPNLPEGKSAGWTFIEDASANQGTAASVKRELDNLEAQVGQDGASTTFASGATSGSDAERILTGVQDNTGSAPTNLTNAVTNVATYIGTLDKTASAVDGQVVTTVTQTNGQVAETKADLTAVKMGGYLKTSDTGAIAATDTLEVAVSKLENAIAKNTVSSTDKTITINTTGSTTDLAVNIDGTTLVKDSTSGVISSDLKILKETTNLDANVREQYKLVYGQSTTAIGDTIKVYKDSALTNVYLGTTGDSLSGEDGTSHESASSTVVTGSGSESLNFIYHLENGNYKMEKVNVESFLQESEFGDGLQVVSNVVSVKVDSASEKDSQSTDFLVVTSSGVKVQGIKDEINRKINALDGTATASTVAAGTDTTPTGDFCVLTKVGEENGVVQEVAASGTYASKSVLLKKVAATGAAEDVTIADSGNLITATTVEGALQEIAQDIDNNHIVNNDVIVATTDTTNHQTTLSVTTGNGLEKVDTDSDSVADTLKVKQGSGITVDNNGVSVNAGDGLVIDSNTNDLNVKPGDGIEIASDAVKIKIAQHQTDANTNAALDANDMFTLTSAGLGLSNVWDCGTY